MATKVVLSGDLAFLSLGDIIQLIGSSAGTGELRIMSKYMPEPGLIYFSKGNVIDGSTPDGSGLEAVFALFGWMDGEFEFSEGPISRTKTINAGRMEIILDGLRKVDDGETPKLGPVSFEKAPAGNRESVPLVKGPLVDYMYVLDEESFTAGQKIVQENKHGSWIWVILEGTVDIMKEASEGPLTVLKLGPGSFIGSVASFLFQDNIRTATAVAATDVQLGVLDSQKLTEEYALRSQEFRNFVLRLDKRRIEVTERTVDIHDKKDLLKFAKGKKPVIKQGKKFDKFLKITYGEGCIVKQTDSGTVFLAQLREGDFFGPVHFLDINHEPFNASILLSKDAETAPVNIHKIHEEYELLSPTLKNLISSIATSISVTTRVACDFHMNNLKEKNKK
ncbi:MAG: cyclic nucleotide-binding domain-containing protein [Thermodesulfobacteriota bacterium]